MNNITFGDEEFGHYETVAGGTGAVSCINIYTVPYTTCQYTEDSMALKDV